MTPQEWRALTARVIVEAAVVDPRDVVLVLGQGADVAGPLRARGAQVTVADGLAASPRGVSIVCVHDWLRRRTPADQKAFLVELGKRLPERGLAVIGDVMWSMPPDMIDEPEQYGDSLTHAQTTRVIEGWAREAGFLPDLHRFSPGVAVLVAVRT
jgi:hypothetical protein